MLQEIVLENFQKHRRLRLKLSPTVTTLIGDNEAGKSTIMRAARFAALNLLAGKPDDYIRFGRPTMHIKLKLDGHWVGRKKGRGRKGANLYTLDGQVFQVPGRGAATMPQQIADLLNVDSSNFQRQLDLPFWFSSTPGQVSKYLNQIVNLEVIDKTLANVAAEVRKSRSATAHTKERFAAAKKEKEWLAYVPKLDKLLRRAERLEAKYDAAEEETRELAVLITAAHRAKQTAETAGRHRRGAAKAVAAGRRAARQAAECRELEKLLGELEAAQPVRVPDIEPLRAVRRKADAVAEDCGELESLLEALKAEGETLCRLKESLDVVEKKLARVPRCPKCGQPVRSSPSRRRTSTSGPTVQWRGRTSRGGSP